MPGEITVDTQAYFGVLRAINTYSPYIRKSLDATLGVTVQLTQLSLRYYDLRRRYLQTSLQGTDASSHGGEIILTRELSFVQETLPLPHVINRHGGATIESKHSFPAGIKSLTMFRQIGGNCF